MTKQRLKRSLVWLFPEDDFISLAEGSRTLAELATRLGISRLSGGCMRASSSQYRMMRDRCQNLGLMGRFDKNKRRKSDRFLKPIESLKRRAGFRQRIMSGNLVPHTCSQCGNPGTWNGKALTLQVHHVNGQSSDNRLENVTFLCPNCHSQTSTFAGRNKIKLTSE